MPYRKRNQPRKKRSNRRYGRVRRDRNKATSSFTKGVGAAITADRMFTKLKFMKTFKLAGTSSVTTVDIRFYGNAIHDCDASTTAQTFNALGYKALANLYTRYRVHGSKCTARFMSTANGSANFAKLTVCPSPADPITTANIISRFPYAKTNLVGSSVGQNIRTISNFMSTKKMLGIKAIDSNPEYDGDMNADGSGSVPQIPWYWHISADSINGSTTFDGSLYVDVEITYFVELFDRVHIQVQDLDDDEVPGQPVDQ